MKKELSFDEQLKYLEENYDGVASLALYKATGGVRCKTMSYENCYIKCTEELRKIFKEHPELLNKEITFNEIVETDKIDLDYEGDEDEYY